MIKTTKKLIIFGIFFILFFLFGCTLPDKSIVPIDQTENTKAESVWLDGKFVSWAKINIDNKEYVVFITNASGLFVIKEENIQENLLLEKHN